MPQTSLPSAAYADRKPHYEILDGLRGVAALLVVVFHLCEAHATSHFDQLLNHGYLAVDFFFALSGFVIGYAYDDRWGRMTVGGFFKRRLIRLQPMVVLGMAVGAALFYFQDCDMWPVHAVPVWKMLAVMLVGLSEGLPEVNFVGGHAYIAAICGVLMVGGILISLVFTSFAVRKFLRMNTSNANLY